MKSIVVMVTQSVDRWRAYLGYDANAPADGGRFSLGSAHTAKTGRQENSTRKVLKTQISATGV